MRTDSNTHSVVMEVEFFRNGDDSIGLVGKEAYGSHGLPVLLEGPAAHTATQTFTTSSPAYCASKDLGECPEALKLKSAPPTAVANAVIIATGG
jgi:hypothetical protein